jgi:hypothetical protein
LAKIAQNCAHNIDPRQKGRSFTFLLVFKDDRNRPQFWASFYQSLDDVLILAKIGWANVCAIFSQASSGHPVS